MEEIYTKYRIAGSVIERKTYEKLNIKGGGNNPGIGEFEDKNYQATNKRRRDNIIWLTLSNFNNNDKFITLTFKDEIKDVKEANKLFKLFILRMRYLYPYLKYMAVIEFQDLNRGGVVHYHMLAKLPFIKAKELQEIWGNGFIKVNSIKHVDNLGAYVVKYMNKDTSDKRLQGLKAYNTSKNLIRWRELRSWEPLEMKYIYNLEDVIKNEKPVYASTYTSDYGGEVNIQQFNFDQNVLYRNDTENIQYCQIGNNAMSE